MIYSLSTFFICFQILRRHSKKKIQNWQWRKLQVLVSVTPPPPQKKSRRSQLAGQKQVWVRNQPMKKQKQMCILKQSYSKTIKTVCDTCPEEQSISALLVTLQGDKANSFSQLCNTPMGNFRFFFISPHVGLFNFPFFLYYIYVFFVGVGVRWVGVRLPQHAFRGQRAI